MTDGIFQTPIFILFVLKINKIKLTIDGHAESDEHVWPIQQDLVDGNWDVAHVQPKLVPDGTFAVFECRHCGLELDDHRLLTGFICN